MGVYFISPKHLNKIPAFTYHQPLPSFGQALSDVTSPVKFVKGISPGCHALSSSVPSLLRSKYKTNIGSKADFTVGNIYIYLLTIISEGTAFLLQGLTYTYNSVQSR